MEKGQKDITLTTTVKLSTYILQRSDIFLHELKLRIFYDHSVLGQFSQPVSEPGYKGSFLNLKIYYLWSPVNKKAPKVIYGKYTGPNYSFYLFVSLVPFHFLDWGNRDNYFSLNERTYTG